MVYYETLCQKRFCIDTSLQFITRKHILRNRTLRFFKDSDPKSSEVGEFDLISSPKLSSLSLTYWGARSTFSCE
jgi:hypothetical protein